jgi:hypothetical protein
MKSSKVVHCRVSAYDVLIDRTTKWGNPFSHQKESKADVVVETRKEAIEAYEEWLTKQINKGELDITELEGKVLGCWCKPLTCHGDIIIKKLQEIENEKNAIWNILD